SPTAASAFVVDRYAALLFAAYRYWRGNGTEHAFDEATVRALLETGTAPAGPVLDPVPPTGYPVLPRNLVRSRVAEGAAAERRAGRAARRFLLGVQRYGRSAACHRGSTRCTRRSRRLQCSRRCRPATRGWPFRGRRATRGRVRQLPARR